LEIVEPEFYRDGGLHMSVSLTLIPVALALRVVMGKDRFENWIRSMECPRKTNFTSERDLIVTVKKGGYDAEKWGSMIKTHINGEKQFFFWEFRNGAWYAIFSKYDSPKLIEDFMRTLEERTGRVIFEMSEENSFVQESVTQIFPTNFRDRDLLIQVLEDNGMVPIEEESGNLVVHLGGAILTFQQSSPGGLITVELSESNNLPSIFRQLSLLDEDYKSYIQEKAYQSVKNKAEDKGFVIEEEQILEDNSIVITLSIKR
jgi:hypothetical protein